MFCDCIGVNSMKNLSDAIKSNNIDEVKEFLENLEIDVNKFVDGQNTPLHIAIMQKNYDIVKLLLSHAKIDVNMCNRDGASPLHVAVMSNDVDIVKLLLENDKLNVNALDKSAVQPLHLMFITQKRDAIIDGNVGTTPLHLAIEGRMFETATLLLKHSEINPNIPDVKGRTPVFIAIADQSAQMLKLLLENKKTDPNSPTLRSYIPLHLAIQLGQLDILGFLLKDDRLNLNKADKSGYTCVFIAILANRPEIIASLLSDPRIDLNKKDDVGHTVWDLMMMLTCYSLKKCLDAVKALSLQKTVDNVAEAMFRKGLLDQNFEAMKLGFDSCTRKGDLLHSISIPHHNNALLSYTVLRPGETGLIEYKFNIMNDKILKFISSAQSSQQQYMQGH